MVHVCFHFHSSTLGFLFIHICTLRRAAQATTYSVLFFWVVCFCVCSIVHILQAHAHILFLSSMHTFVAPLSQGCAAHISICKAFPFAQHQGLLCVCFHTPVIFLYLYMLPLCILHADTHCVCFHTPMICLYMLPLCILQAAASHAFIPHLHCSFITGMYILAKHSPFAQHYQGCLSHCLFITGMYIFLFSIKRDVFFCCTFSLPQAQLLLVSYLRKNTYIIIIIHTHVFLPWFFPTNIHLFFG